MRAQVGFTLAAVTASRMIKRGQLVRLRKSRPAIVALPAAPSSTAPHASLGAALAAWRRPGADHASHTVDP